MKSSTVISILVAFLLAPTSMSSFAQQGQGGGAHADRAKPVDRERTYDRGRISDRGRTQDRDRSDDREQDRDRLQDPASLEDKNIYGNKLMSDAERRQYRDQLGNMNTQETRMKLQARHEQKMQERALQQGQDLVPQGQGPVYGGEFMSVQERNKHREQLRLIDSDKERERFQAQHRKHINQRAEALGLEVEEAK